MSTRGGEEGHDGLSRRARLRGWLYAKLQAVREGRASEERCGARKGRGCVKFVFSEEARAWAQVPDRRKLTRKVTEATAMRRRGQAAACFIGKGERYIRGVFGEGRLRSVAG